MKKRTNVPSRLGIAMVVSTILTATPPLLAQASGSAAVTGFGDRGWAADDVRDAEGTNIVNDTTHAPAPGAAYDPAAVQEQIAWKNSIGTFGNLGGVSLSGTSTDSGKSTMSVLAASGSVAAGEALGESFRAVYRWQNTDTVDPGLSLKIGLQSARWDESQSGFQATRSGEATWDLILVADPTYSPGGATPTNGQFITSVVDFSTTKFKLFSQAGNGFFNGTAVGDYLGGGNVARTLEEWRQLDSAEFGNVLFGAGSTIANTQFGFGSGNAGASGTLDFARISYLNDGQTVDFVDAVRYTGPGGDYGDAANWGGTTPSSGQNLIVDQDATLNVSGTQDTRSLGVISGTTNLVLNEESKLVLHSAENGTLSSAAGATLHVSGPGVLQGSVIETAGTTHLAAKIELDGGAKPNPVRDGTNPAASSRYGLVVVENGSTTLQDGADVTLAQTGKNVGVRVGEGAGIATLTVEEGSRLEIGTPTDRGFFVVGDFGATGIFNQTGGEVSVVGAVNIGAQGGTGVWNFSGGTFHVGLHEDGTDSNGVSIGARRTGSNAAPTGELNVSGDAQLILTRGYLMVGGDTSPTSGGTGVVNQTGGLVRIIKDGLALGAGASGTATGTYNLNGGVLEVGGTNGIQAGGSGGGTGIFNFGGGTIRVIAKDLTTNVALNLVEGTTSTIDTNGFTAVLRNGLSGTGGFTKASPGTLVLGGITNLAKDSTVHGHLSVGASNAPAGTLNIAENTTLSVKSVPGQSGTASQSRLWVGRGGTGNLNINGGHIVVNIAAGAQASGITIGQDGGVGTGTMSGGSVTFEAGAGSYGTFNLGWGTGTTGSFTQTGGRVDIAGGALQIGVQGGKGTYTVDDQAEVRLGPGSTIYIGEGSGGNGLVEVRDAGRFTQGAVGAVAGQFYLGAQGATGKVLQTGKDSVVSIVTENPIHIGFTSGAAGSSGTYQLDDGTLTMGTTFSTGVRIGESSNATGAFLQNGGDSTFVLRNVYVGAAGTGSFTVNGGTATIDAALVLAQSAGSNGTLNLNGGTLAVGGTNGIAKGAGTAAFNLGGGTLKVTKSDLTTNVGATLVAQTLSTIHTNGLNATFTGELSGDGGLTKVGGGKLTLAGQNTYTGETRVTGGTLAVVGSISSSSLTTVGAGGTLTGGGRVGDLRVAAGGTISPGSSPGILSADDTAWDGGGAYVWELNSALGTAGVNWDLLDVTGTLSLNATEANPFTVRVASLNASNNPGDVADFDPTQTYTWIIASTTSGIAGFRQDAFSIDASGFSNVRGGNRFSLSVSNDGQNLVLTYSAVPEPAVYGAVLGMGVLLLAMRRRFCS